MARIIKIFFYPILILYLLVSCNNEKLMKSYKIGVVMPKSGYEQVILGLKEAINLSNFKDRVEIIIKNFPSNNEEFEPAVNMLLQQDVDLFYTVTTPATITTYNKVKEKPIIFAAVGDPVGAGLAENYKSPKKGITGVTNLSRELTGKRFEYFKMAFPGMKKILTFYNPNNVYSILALKDLETISQKFNVLIDKEEVTTLESLKSLLKNKINKRVDGIFIIPDPIVMAGLDDIINFAKENRLPTCVHEEKFVTENDATLSFGVDLKEVGKMSYIMVEHVLKGGTPESLPIFIPEKMNLVINNRWAEKNGYNIPNEILYLADKVLK